MLGCLSRCLIDFFKTPHAPVRPQTFPTKLCSKTSTSGSAATIILKTVCQDVPQLSVDLEMSSGVSASRVPASQLALYQNFGLYT